MKPSGNLGEGPRFASPALDRLLIGPPLRGLDHGVADAGTRKRGGPGPALPGQASPAVTSAGGGPVSSLRQSSVVPATSYPRDPLRTEETVQAWRDFLARFPMQWFCTFTFTDSVHPERAGKLFRLLVRRLNRHLYGSHHERRGLQGVFWVLASEYQKRGVLHFHALIGDVTDLNARARRLDWMDRWLELGPPAGYARIEAIDSQDAVRAYTTKYVTKGGQIDLSASLRGFAQQQALSTPSR